MAKTLISEIITQIEEAADYVPSETDTDLSNQILRYIKRALKTVKQLLLNEGLTPDITASATFKTVEDQEYVDIQKARIVGNVASFTAVANDKIVVTIDGTDYTTAILDGAVLVATVVTAINTAYTPTGDVASESDDGYLVITSPTSGATSSVVIADSAGTPASRLFTVAAERTQSAISDVDEIIQLSERVNDTPIGMIPFHIYRKLSPDPSIDTSTSPLQAALHKNYIYFRPRPTSNILIYIDYYIDIGALTTSSSMPIKDKYDPVAVAMAKKELVYFLDKNDAVGLRQAERDIELAVSTLITNAATNIAEVRELGSRTPEEPYFAPREPTEMGS